MEVGRGEKGERENRENRERGRTEREGEQGESKGGQRGTQAGREGGRESIFGTSDWQHDATQTTVSCTLTQQMLKSRPCQTTTTLPKMASYVVNP